MLPLPDPEHHAGPDEIRVPRWFWEYVQDLDLVADLPLWKRHLLAAQMWRKVEPRLCGACLGRFHLFGEEF